MQAQKTSGLIFAGMVRWLMDQRDLTQEQVAAGVGITQGAVCGWLKGSLPSGEALHRAAVFFGVSMETLLTGRALAINSADEFLPPLPPAVNVQQVLRMTSQTIEALTKLRDELERRGEGL